MPRCSTLRKANSCLLRVEQDQGKDAAGTLRLTTAMRMFDLQGRPAWRLQELITTVYCVSELVLSPCRCRCRHPSGLTVGWPSTPARDVFLFTAGSLANTGPGNGADEARHPASFRALPPLGFPPFALVLT